MLRNTFLLFSIMFATAAYAEPLALPDMSVTSPSGGGMPYSLPQNHLIAADSGELAKRLPGTNINQNGPLTSIVQYRGMYAERVNVMLDGVAPSAAGPNRMDSPLSYLPASLIDNIAVYRGIAPISSGPETIGGTIKVESKQADYGNSETFELQGHLNSLYATNGHMRLLGLVTSLANQNHRLQFSGSLDRSHDQEFDGGDIIPSQAKRDTLGLNYGFQKANTEFNFNLHHLNTGKTGTSALPMDILWIRGETLKASINQTVNNGGQFTAQIHYQDVDHRMDNFSLRPAGMVLRYNDADVLAKGIELGYSIKNWKFGVSVDHAQHNSTIYDPGSPLFFIRNFNKVKRDRLSAFVEWKGAISDHWKMQSGLRLTQVNSASGEVSTSVGMARSLANNFNNSDRRQQHRMPGLARSIYFGLNLNW